MIQVNENVVGTIMVKNKNSNHKDNNDDTHYETEAS